MQPESLRNHKQPHIRNHTHTHTPIHKNTHTRAHMHTHELSSLIRCSQIYNCQQEMIKAQKETKVFKND